MVSLPGSYPLDDSVPATPEEPSSHRHHSHHDRNKLHKPNDPRSHQQSDSGVAGFGQHEADSSRAHAPSGNEYLDATGGDYYTYEPMKASSAVESENIHSTAPRATHQDIQHDIQQEPHSREAQSSQETHAIDTDKSSSSKFEEGSPKQGDTSESAPYWGDLPKGQRGGIYNTVTGHGSAKDDHDQHHHIPERSAARERSHIPGPVGAATEKSTSRVYNTVTGHGSRDQESKRHTASSRASGATVSSTEAVHDAPLVGIPEEKPFDTGLSSTAIPSSDLGMGFLPETAAGDDAKLLARHEEQARSHDTSRTGPSVAWATEMSGPKTTQPSDSTSGPKPDTMHQRAFPLGPSNMMAGEDAMKSRSAGPQDANLGAADTSKSTKDKDTMPSSDDHRGRDAMLAGAGVAGTGIAASEFADRHERNRESRRSISEDRHGRKRLSKTDKKYKDTSSSGSDYSNHKDKPSPEERKSHDEGSPKGEKLSHKILGIFGLNKDEKPAQEEPAPEPAKESSPSRHGAFGRHKHDKGLPDTSTTEPPKEKARDKSPRHSGDKKKEAAVGAAAGLGAAGLMSRKNDEEKNKHHQEPAESSRHHEHHNQTKDGKQTSVQPSQQPVSHDFAQPTTKTSGPASSTAQGPIGLSKQSPASAGHSRTENINTVPNFSQPNPTDRSKAAPMAAAGLGAAAVGAGAYQASHRHDEPARSQPTAPPSTAASSATTATPTTSAYAFENPRAPAHHNTASSTTTVTPTTSAYAFENPRAPAHHNTESRGQTAGAGSGVAQGSSRKHPVVTNKPGEYNTLSSGTASGVATDALPHPPTTSHDQGKGSSSKYGALSSGTASGVKSQHGAQGSITQKPGEYNSLQSGTASGVKTHDEPQRAATQSSRDKTSHSGTASGVAAATAIGAGAYAHKEKESSRRGSTGAYNKLASGTPSGVVVEPRKHRASEDQGRRPGDYKLFPTDSSSPQMHQQRGAGSDTGSGNTQQSYQLPPPPMSGSSANTGSTGVQDSKRNDVGQSDKHSSGPGFVSVPIHSRSPRHDQHHENTNKDTADRVRHMSPEVMPSEYTTSSPRTGNMSHSAPYGNASNADQVRHMSPEVMPSSYTSSAPRSTQLSHSGDMTSAGQGATAHSHSSDVDPALAAATGAWASTGGPSVIGGSGLPAMNRGSGGKVMHTCEHCGKENDITAYVASHQAI